MTAPISQRYYVYLKKSIRGPFAPREIAQLAGFGRSSLVCTEKSLGQWIEASLVPEFQALLDAPPPAPVKPKPPRQAAEAAEEQASRALLEKAIAKNAALEREVRELRKTYHAEKAAFEAAAKKKDWEIKSLAEKARRGAAAAVETKGEHPSWEMLYKTLKKRSEEKFCELTQAQGEKAAELNRALDELRKTREAAEAAKKQWALDEENRVAALKAELADLRSQLEERDVVNRSVADNMNSLLAKNEELQRIMLDERRDAEEQAKKFCEEIGRLRSELKWREQEAEKVRADLEEAVRQARSMEAVDALKSREQQELYGVLSSKLRILSGYFDNMEARLKFAFRKA